MIAKVEYIPELRAGINCKIIVSRTGRTRRGRFNTFKFTTNRYESKDIGLYDLYQHKTVFTWPFDNIDTYTLCDHYTKLLNKDHHEYMMLIVNWINNK